MVPKNTIALGQSQEFFLRVFAPYDQFLNQTITSQIVYAIEEDPIILEYKCLRNCFDNFFNPFKAMLLNVTSYIDLSPYKISWMYGTKNGDFQKLTEFTSTNINLKTTHDAFKLDEFELLTEVERLSRITGKVRTFKNSIKFVKSQVKAGVCSFTPEKGEAVGTLFTIKCQDFTTDRPPFWYYLFNRKIFLGSFYSTEVKVEYETFLAFSNVVVEACNEDEVCTSIELNIPVWNATKPEVLLQKLPFIFETGNLSRVHTLIESIKPVLAKSLVHLDFIVNGLDEFYEFTDDSAIQLNGILATLMDIYPVDSSTIRKFTTIMSKVADNLISIMKDGQIKEITQEYLFNFTVDAIDIIAKIVNNTDTFPVQYIPAQEPNPETFAEYYADYGEISFDAVQKTDQWYSAYKIVQKYWYMCGATAWYILTPENVPGDYDNAFYHETELGKYLVAK